MSNNSEVGSMSGDLHVDYGSTLFMCILYITLGCVSTCLSLLNLTIFFSNSEFRKKFVFFAAIDVGDLIDAISYILVGTGRLSGLLSGRITVPISIYDCFYHRYWPQSLILGTELPALGTILISIERICAVLRPGIYNRIFTNSRKLLILSSLPAWAVLSLLAAGLSVLGDEGKEVTSTQHCAIITSTAKWFSTWHFVFVSVAYMVSFGTTFVVWFIRRKFARESHAVEGQNFGAQRSAHKKLVVILVMSGSSIILVSMPSAVMIMIRWELHEFNDITVALTYAMPGFLSVANTIINFCMRPEMRKQFKYLIGLRSERAYDNSHSHVPTTMYNNGNGLSRVTSGFKKSTTPISMVNISAKTSPR